MNRHSAMNIVGVLSLITSLLITDHLMRPNPLALSLPIIAVFGCMCVELYVAYLAREAELWKMMILVMVGPGALFIGKAMYMGPGPEVVPLLMISGIPISIGALCFFWGCWIGRRPAPSTRRVDYPFTN